MNCASCNHPKDHHCRGKIEHVTWKSERLQNGASKETTICVGRHCELPLCCCVEFQEAA
jgi:hypothetical protein